MNSNARRNDLIARLTRIFGFFNAVKQGLYGRSFLSGLQSERFRHGGKMHQLRQALARQNQGSIGVGKDQG
jgi:hypothetical protein